jgi:hypothetical protein
MPGMPANSYIWILTVWAVNIAVLMKIKCIIKLQALACQEVSLGGSPGTRMILIYFDLDYSGEFTSK